SANLDLVDFHELGPLYGRLATGVRDQWTERPADCEHAEHCPASPQSQADPMYSDSVQHDHLLFRCAWLAAARSRVVLQRRQFLAKSHLRSPARRIALRVCTGAAKARDGYERIARLQRRNPFGRHGSSFLREVVEETGTPKTNRPGAKVSTRAGEADAA